MKQQKEGLTVEEGNRIIAEFMGSEYLPDRNLYYKGGMLANTFPNGNHYARINQLSYNSSWDWLMPAIKKFDYLAEEKDIPYSDDYEFWCDKIEDAITRTYEIKKAFSVFAEAIQWYNQTQNQIKDNGK